MVIKSFGSTIKKIRVSRNRIQEQLSEPAGINPKYLGEIERGKKNPSALITCKLANILELPICEIRSKTGCPFVNDKAREEN